MARRAISSCSRPAFEAAQTTLLRGDDARFDPTPPADRGSIELGNTLSLGSEAGDQVIMEIDLSAYLDRRDGSDRHPASAADAGLPVTVPDLPTKPPATLTFVNNTIFF